jgi:rhodanese-related sulfurtransferase
MWYAFGGAAILVVIAVMAYLLVQDTPAVVEVKIPASQAFEKYQSGAFFLDVRSQVEWDEVHIPNSTLIPLDELPGRLTELPTDREIVAVCLVGKRSQEGQKILADAGIENVFCLDGGIQEWQAAGYPLKEKLILF